MTWLFIISSTSICRMISHDFTWGSTLTVTTGYKLLVPPHHCLLCQGWPVGGFCWTDDSPSDSVAHCPCCHGYWLWSSRRTKDYPHPSHPPTENNNSKNIHLIHLKKTTWQTPIASTYRKQQFDKHPSHLICHVWFNHVYLFLWTNSIIPV